MAWVAVDKDGEEYIYKKEPERNLYFWDTYNNGYVRLPDGTIKKLIGKELTWNDEPVELK